MSKLAGKLDFEVAQHLASSLVTIGHPFQKAAIEATAVDLVKWCQGYFAGATVIDPERQAEQLVDRARVEWEDGWPEHGGTKRLRLLFEQMYPAKAVALTPADPNVLKSRGLLALPCPLCSEDAPFCEYGGRRGHQRFLDDQKHLAPAPALKNRPTINLDAILHNGEQLWRDEQIRKQRQLADVSSEQLDYRSVS